MKTPGFYKVKYQGVWEVAELGISKILWFRTGTLTRYKGSDFDEIGEKIKL